MLKFKTKQKKNISLIPHLNTFKDGREPRGLETPEHDHFSQDIVSENQRQKFTTS